MITSTSINAAFIAKLVHAANVAIGRESYCEIRTSKGKPSVLVEYNKQSNSLLVTHVSGQDCTSVLWKAIRHLVALPSAEHVSMAEQEEPSSYGFIQAYLLFVMLGVLVDVGVLSYGIALLVGGFAVMSYRLLSVLSNSSSTDPTEAYREADSLPVPQ